MNCCNAYGHCTQGTDCAARRSMDNFDPVKHHAAGSVWFVDSPLSPPDELANPSTFTCEKIGYCMGRADCACVDGLALYSPLPATVARMANVPPEAGNSRLHLDPFADADDADIWWPLSLRDCIQVYGCVGLFVLAWVTGLAMLTGYGWAMWSKGLMAYLSGVLPA